MSTRQHGLNVILADRQRTRKLDKNLIRRRTLQLLREVGVTHSELGLTFVCDAEMTRINETFLKHEGSTDVITFDHSEHLTPHRKTARKKVSEIHGELFICIDEADRQAKRFRTTWQSEVLRYIVHGVLHLLGYDDHNAADRRMMKRKENGLVSKLSGIDRRPRNENK